MTVKTEHVGAKNGGGYWGKREEAKRKSSKVRRAQDREAGTVNLELFQKVFAPIVEEL